MIINFVKKHNVCDATATSMGNKKMKKNKVDIKEVSTRNWFPLGIHIHIQQSHCFIPRLSETSSLSCGRLDVYHSRAHSMIETLLDRTKYIQQGSESVFDTTPNPISRGLNAIDAPGPASNTA